MFRHNLNIYIIIFIFNLVFVPLSSAVSQDSASPTTPVKKISPFSPTKSSYNILLPPAMSSEIFSATLTAAQVTVQFNIPKSVYPKENLQVQYQLTGIGLAAVEATAFENPAYLSQWVYTTSAFPKDMDIIFNYLGAMPSNKAGDYPKKLFPKLINRFSTKNYYLILFEIRNFGKSMLKSHGYGQVKYLIKIVNPTSPNIELYTLPRISPKPDFELYPGEKKVVSYLIKPLPPGTYLLKMLAVLNNDIPVAETDLTMTVIKDNLPDLGTVIPETIPLLAPPMFPTTIKEWQEPLHAFRIHELTEPNNLKISGILSLSMPKQGGTVVLRLITPPGLATTTVLVTLDKHKRSKR